MTKPQLPNLHQTVFNTFLSINISSCSSAAGGDTHGGGRFPLGRRPPALRKHSFRNKITLQEKVSDFLLPVPWVSASILNDHFHASNVQEKRKWASETETVICLVTVLPGPGLGRNGNLENVAKRFVSVFSKQCLLHVPCLGAGHG